jgi:hypothetical protein
MVNKKRLIEIPDDGIIKISIMQGNSTVGERIIDLSHFPTVDAVEVVHGHWIKEENSIHCSVCGYITPALIPYVDNGDRWIPLYANKYCGNCGAKMMDGDGNE